MKKKPSKCSVCGKELKGKHKYCKKCYKIHRKNYFKEYKRKEKEILKAKVKKEIGYRCIICNTTKKIIYHETNGKNHISGRMNRVYKFYLKNKDSFVPICRKHHRLLHYVISQLDSMLELEKTVELALKIMKNKAY